MSLASDNASLFAQRPDAAWQGNQIRAAINTYARARRLDPDNEPELAAILYFALLEITDRAEKHDRGELGRQLANWRDDLIAAGVDPSELKIPIHPDDLRW